MTQLTDDTISRALDPHPAGSAHERLRALAGELAAWEQAERVLYWDERTFLPEASVRARTGQRSLLATRAHELLTSAAMEQAIDAAREELPGSVEAAAVGRRRRLALQLGADFTTRFTEAKARCRDAWHRGRLADDFATWQDELARMLELTREQAELIGYETEPYDALLDTWEPGVTAAEVAAICEAVAPVRDLMAHQQPADEQLLRRTFEPARKLDFERELLTRIGFDFTRGRIDYSPRAFCIVLGPDDVRLTTRFHGDGRITPLFSSLHEAGHGIYAQSFGRLGVPVTLAEVPGLGIDEAQSRMYENIICRSRGFWEHNFELLVESFPGVVEPDELEAFHRSVTTVRPGSIRVGSDELSYNFHIQLRFELERAMVNGELEVADLPEAWNARAAELLGQAPASDQVGCLQDVHWSIGQWGYFPTYLLGNVYSAQLWAQLSSEQPGIEDDIAQGRMDRVHDWFDEHVYRFGCAMTGPELVERATGDAVSAQPLVDYLRDRYGP